LPPHTDGEMGLSYPIFRLPNYPQATGTLPNRLITQYDLNMIYLSGPGHGGPALVANTYLEGIYS